MKVIGKVGRRLLKSIGLLTLLGMFVVPSAAMADKYRVALIHPGTPTDLSWSNAWIDGAKNAMAGNPNIEVVSVDLVFDPASYLQQGAAFASQGFDFVLMAHGAMVDQGITLAQQFPNVQFCVAPHHPSEATLPPNQPKNLCWIDVAQHNANFFAGALAAMVTKSGHVASLNGFAFPALTRQAEGFHLGARCVNPDIRFSQQYINTWTDTGIAKAAAQAVFATDADVIMAPTDSAVFGIVQAAKEALGQGRGQVWIIPSYYESQVLGPEVVLTSAIHGLTFASQAMIERGASGSIGESSFHDFDATNNPEIYAPVYDNIRKLLSPEQLARYEEIAEKVRSGEITIPDETTGDYPIGAIDSGASVDLAAIGCK